MVGTYCISGHVLAKVGKFVSGEFVSGSALARIPEFIHQAESVVNAAMRKDLTGDYSSLTSGAKLILQDATSSLAAIQCIQYDMENFPSRIDAEDCINVQRDRALMLLGMLKDQNVRKFVETGESS